MDVLEMRSVKGRRTRSEDDALAHPQPPRRPLGIDARHGDRHAGAWQEPAAAFHRYAGGRPYYAHT